MGITVTIPACWAMTSDLCMWKVEPVQPKLNRHKGNLHISHNKKEPYSNEKEGKNDRCKMTLVTTNLLVAVSKQGVCLFSSRGRRSVLGSRLHEKYLVWWSKQSLFLYISIGKLRSMEHRHSDRKISLPKGNPPYYNRL